MYMQIVDGRVHKQTLVAFAACCAGVAAGASAMGMVRLCVRAQRRGALCT